MGCCGPAGSSYRVRERPKTAVKENVGSTATPALHLSLCPLALQHCQLGQHPGDPQTSFPAPSSSPLPSISSVKRTPRADLVKAMRTFTTQAPFLFCPETQLLDVFTIQLSSWVPSLCKLFTIHVLSCVGMLFFLEGEEARRLTSSGRDLEKLSDLKYHTVCFMDRVHETNRKIGLFMSCFLV